MTKYTIPLRQTMFGSGKNHNFKRLKLRPIGWTKEEPEASEAPEKWGQAEGTYGKDYRIVDGEGKTVARVPWTRGDAGPLLAAAPELLSVLTEFLCDQETLNEPFRNEAICEKARAAIAKAKGKT